MRIVIRYFFPHFWRLILTPLVSYAQRAIGGWQTGQRNARAQKGRRSVPDLAPLFQFSKTARFGSKFVKKSNASSLI